MGNGQCARDCLIGSASLPHFLIRRSITARVYDAGALTLAHGARIL